MQCTYAPCTCETVGGADMCSPSCGTGDTSATCHCGHSQCESSPQDSRKVDGDVFDPHTVAESMTAPNTTTEYDGRP